MSYGSAWGDSVNCGLSDKPDTIQSNIYSKIVSKFAGQNFPTHHRYQESHLASPSPISQF